MAANVDLVLVIDTSVSMRPCIDQLKQYLQELIKPMQGYVGKVRFGLVGMSASRNGENVLYQVETLPLTGLEAMKHLYAPQTQYDFFSDDPDKVIARLAQLQIKGDEDNLLALDIAIDHPFGPSSTTKRVVALFSDEKIENGVQRAATKTFIPRLIEKLHARRIKLFCALPYSDGAQKLSEADGSEIEDVGNGQGLAAVDFKTLLGQMGKSISGTSLQAAEEHYERAIFGQDKWVLIEQGWKDSDA